MSDDCSQPVITRAGFLVLIAIIIGGLCLLLPAIQAAREMARSHWCINNMKIFGLAMQGYHNVWDCFPPSMLERPSGHFLSASGPVPGSDNTNGTGADFSWQVLLLPHMEEGNCFEKLDVANGFPFDGNPDHRSVAADPRLAIDSDFGDSHLICQSFKGSAWSGAPEYDPKAAAISNYVALGATHLASLYRTETRPIGGAVHPNGTIYPGSRTSYDDITDGTTNTFIACETREQNYAAWIDGTTAAVVGLAEQTDPTFRLVEGESFYAPTDSARTTINWGNDRKGRHYLSAADHSGSKPWTHGPSSFHPGLVNHLLGDGSVRSVQEDIDPTLYMHLITRAGGEPVNEFFED